MRQTIMKMSPNKHVKTTPKSFARAQRELSKVATLWAEGLALHEAGRLENAEKIYNRILVMQPDHFDSLHLLGVISHQRGNHAEAVDKISVALKIKPHDVPALNNLGNALLALRDFVQALASYDRAISKWPD